MNSVMHVLGWVLLGINKLKDRKVHLIPVKDELIFQLPQLQLHDEITNLPLIH